MTFARDIPGHDAAQGIGANGGHMERAHLTVALDKRHDTPLGEEAVTLERRQDQITERS
jgi:hypothetical protein